MLPRRSCSSHRFKRLPCFLEVRVQVFPKMGIDAVPTVPFICGYLGYFCLLPQLPSSLGAAYVQKKRMCIPCDLHVPDTSMTICKSDLGVSSPLSHARFTAATAESGLLCLACMVKKCLSCNSYSECIGVTTVTRIGFLCSISSILTQNVSNQIRSHCLDAPM